MKHLHFWARRRELLAGMRHKLVRREEPEQEAQAWLKPWLQKPGTAIAGGTRRVVSNKAHEEVENLHGLEANSHNKTGKDVETPLGSGRTSSSVGVSCRS